MNFDDLMSASRTLDENPFDDPFAKRSSSPDPWASPFAQQDESESSTFYQDQSQPSIEDHAPSESTSLIKEPDTITSAQLDPLDTAAHAAADEDTSSPTKSALPRSPGFLEDIPRSVSEITTIRPNVPEEKEPSIPTPVEEHPPITPATPQPFSPTTPSSFTPERQDSTINVQQARVASPTEPSLSQSFSGIGLGGDTGEGWQEDRTSWSREPSTSTASERRIEEDDSDDDKPIAQVNKFAAKQANLPPHNDDGPSVFVITVDDPQKVGDPIRSFTMYTVHTRTNSTLFQKSAFSVLRRYSDFLWLYETLSINNPGVIVPPVPEKNPFGRFDNHFVSQRRFALEKCIQKIANHPVLNKDSDFKLFLESDTFALDIKQRKAEIAHERGGLIASLGQSFTGARFHETDEWFERQKVYLDSLESQLRGLVKAIEAVARQRTDLAIATGEFSQSVNDLSTSDISRNLSQSLAGLANVERKAQELQEVQSQQDMVTFLGTVDEYARLINSVRLAFNSRVRTYNAWRSADADVSRVKQTHERNRAQGRIPQDRMGYSLNQVAEAERRALEAKHEFDNCSRLIKSEMARFEKERIEDFKNSLHAFLEGMISRQKELIGKWEEYQQSLLKKIGNGKEAVPVPVDTSAA